MKTPRSIRSLVLCCLATALCGSSAFAGGPFLRKIPDFTQGVPKEVQAQWCTALGSTGAFGWIYADKTYRSSDGVRQILVTDIMKKNSPASGMLEVHDVILGAAAGPKANPFKQNARAEFSQALAIAEEPEMNGNLTLEIWRKGLTKQIKLTISVRGAYNPQDPFNCEKTQTTAEIVGKLLLKRRLNGGIDECVDALGLLATGDRQYLPMVTKFAHKLAASILAFNAGNWPSIHVRDGNALTGKSWYLGYLNLFLTEYQLATGDKEVLTAIKSVSQMVALGRSGIGTWSHGLAHPWENDGKLYSAATSYGAMNRPGVTLTIGLVLAQKCGVNSEEIITAIRKASDHLRFYVDKGDIPYGDHEPWMAHDDNGKNSHADVLKAGTGQDYRNMMAHVKKVFADIEDYHLAYNKKDGFEIAGFIWFQGWNDLVNSSDYRDDPEHPEAKYALYSKLKTTFIHDVREDLNAPRMPFVIGVIGVGGDLKPGNKRPYLRKAMAAPASLEEFKGTVKAVYTHAFWDAKAQVLLDKVEEAANKRLDQEYPEYKSKPKAREGAITKIRKTVQPEVLTKGELAFLNMAISNGGYHYNGAAYTYGKSGKAFADAMAEMSGIAVGK